MATSPVTQSRSPISPRTSGVWIVRHCGSWFVGGRRSRRVGHPLLGLTFSPMRSRAPCVWRAWARRYSEGLRQDGLSQSEVGKNVNRLSVGKDCRGVITVVRHWLVNGSCGCDRNRTQDPRSGVGALASTLIGTVLSRRCFSYRNISKTLSKGN